MSLVSAHIADVDLIVCKSTIIGDAVQECCLCVWIYNYYSFVLVTSRIFLLSSCVTAGSVLEAIANAVEKAATVLVCLTRKYKDSPNCRAGKENSNIFISVVYRCRSIDPLLAWRLACARLRVFTAFLPDASDGRIPSFYHVTALIRNLRRSKMNIT